MTKSGKVLALSIILTVFVSLIGCSKTDPEPKTEQFITLTISAAASLKDSLIEIQKTYTQQNPGIKLTFNFGGSGTLQQQIEQGAPVDLFISADKTQVDALDKKHLLTNGTSVDLLGNDLVLAVGKDNTSITSIQDLSKSSIGKIAIGAPETVPAGKYAKEFLTNLNMWSALQEKMIPAKDVTQVLNYLETGNVDAGFVYKSDAQGSTKVKIVAVAPTDSHSPIVYPAAVVESSNYKQQAQNFLNYLQTFEAQQIFTVHGFHTLKKY